MADGEFFDGVDAECRGFKTERLVGVPQSSYAGIHGTDCRRAVVAIKSTIFSSFDQENLGNDILDWSDMADSLWNRPVKIRLRGLEMICIRTTTEAARCLIDDWPAKEGDIYRLAVASCTNALRGRLPDIAARIHFIAAAHAADLNPVVYPDIKEPDQLVAGLFEECARTIFSPN